jgi:hypothetical protein
MQFECIEVAVAVAVKQPSFRSLPTDTSHCGMLVATSLHESPHAHLSL